MAKQGAVMAILTHQQVAMADILADPLFLRIMHSPPSEIISYFEDPENMGCFLDWALTKEYSDHDNWKILARNSVQAITENSLSFLRMLGRNPIFVHRIIGFPESSDCFDAECCGRFAQIIESMVQYANCDFLEKVLFLFQYFVDNQHILMIKELTVFLVTNYPQQVFSHNPILFLDLSQTSVGIRSMFEIIKIKPELVIFCESDDLINALFDVSDDHFTLVYALQIIKTIAEKSSNPQIPAMIETRSFAYDFDNVTISTPYAIRLFRRISPVIVQHGFTSSNTFLMAALIDYFKDHPHDIPLDILMSEYKKTKTNGYLRILCGLVESHDSKWIEFKNYIETKNLQAKPRSYGGFNETHSKPCDNQDRFDFSQYDCDGSENNATNVQTEVIPSYDHFCREAQI